MLRIIRDVIHTSIVARFYCRIKFHLLMLAASSLICKCRCDRRHANQNRHNDTHVSSDKPFHENPSTSSDSFSHAVNSSNPCSYVLIVRCLSCLLLQYCKNVLIPRSVFICCPPFRLQRTTYKHSFFYAPANPAIMGSLDICRFHFSVENSGFPYSPSPFPILSASPKYS